MPVAGRVEDPDQLETEDTNFERDGDTLDAYLARPKASGARPAIVIVHEAMGVDGHIRDVTRRFAAAGFTALAPELYSRVGRPVEGDREDMFRKMFSMRDADLVADLDAAAELLRSRDDATGKVGIVGFCFGGRTALLAACSTTAFDAAVDCWGGFITRATPDDETTEARPRPVVDLVDQLHGRLYVALGAEDRNPSVADGDELSRRLKAAGKEADAEIEVYGSAGHAFFNDRREEMYREDAAHRLWDRMLTFFRETLDG
jgi:carboxymethylenebutenolidase